MLRYFSDSIFQLVRRVPRLYIANETFRQIVNEELARWLLDRIHPNETVIFGGITAAEMSAVVIGDHSLTSELIGKVAMYVYQRFFNPSGNRTFSTTFMSSQVGYGDDFDHDTAQKYQKEKIMLDKPANARDCGIGASEFRFLDGLSTEDFAKAMKAAVESLSHFLACAHYITLPPSSTDPGITTTVSPVDWIAIAIEVKNFLKDFEPFAIDASITIRKVGEYNTCAIEKMGAFVITEEFIGKCYIYPYLSIEEATQSCKRWMCCWVLYDLNGKEQLNGGIGFSKNTCRKNGLKWLLAYAKKQNPNIMQVSGDSEWQLYLNKANESLKEFELFKYNVPEAALKNGMSTVVGSCSQDDMKGWAVIKEKNIENCIIYPFENVERAINYCRGKDTDSWIAYDLSCNEKGQGGNGSSKNVCRVSGLSWFVKFASSKISEPSSSLKDEKLDIAQSLKNTIISLREFENFNSIPAISVAKKGENEACALEDMQYWLVNEESSNACVIYPFKDYETAQRVSKKLKNWVLFDKLIKEIDNGGLSNISRKGGLTWAKIRFENMTTELK